MNNILIAGDIDITTSVNVYNFPLREEDEVIYIPNKTADMVGGSVLNIGAPLKNWGFNVDIISNVGNDMYQDSVRNALRKNGISAKYLNPAYTVRSIILVSDTGDKLILHDSKDAMTIKPDISKYITLLKKTDFAHLCIFNWTRYLIPELKKRNIKFGTDIHTGFDIDGYHKEFVENSYILFFSKKGMDNSFREIMRKILNMGPEIVVCTAGADGCYVLTREKNEIMHFPALKFSSKIVDTTGAGDNFAAGFYYGLFNFNSIEKAVRYAQIAALYSCGFQGTNTFISKDEFARLGSV